MTHVNNTLEERNKTHGDYDRQAAVAQDLKDAILCGLVTADKMLPPAHQEALDMICVKIARIVVGDHNHADSWHDIAGYATLAERSTCVADE